MAYMFTDKDREKVRAMMDLGVDRRVANTIIYLMEEPGFSMDIEEGTGLKQPEVSTAIRDLRNRGWLEEEKINEGGQGRPRVRFTLSAGTEDVMEFVMKDSVESINRIEQAISKFEALMVG
jgi:predicted transcriptional regulator